MRNGKLSRKAMIVGGVILVLVIAGVVAISFSLFGRDGNKQTGDGEVRWAFNEQSLAWFVQEGMAPPCKDPFVFDRSPVDLSKILVVGMPGAYRGFSYKPHGGLRLANPESGKIDVVMPTNATLVGLTRYYEGNPSELQYLLTFETDCGVAFRFDHLYTLAPAFQAIAETTPAPKKDDTRTDPNIPFKRTKFKSGEVVATEVGFPQTKNFGFDFGTYDYRQRNDNQKIRNGPQSIISIKHWSGMGHAG